MNKPVKVRKRVSDLAEKQGFTLKRSNPQGKWRLVGSTGVSAPVMPGRRGRVFLDLEEAEDWLREGVATQIQMSHPANFRAPCGTLCLVRCMLCGTTRNGRENWLMAVSTGRCCWCGWGEPELGGGDDA